MCVILLTDNGNIHPDCRTIVAYFTRENGSWTKTVFCYTSEGKRRVNGAQPHRAKGLADTALSSYTPNI